MNSNNRLTLLVLVAAGIFAAGFGLFVLGGKLYDGLSGRDDQLTRLREEDAALTTRLVQLDRARKDVNKWKAISLPGNLARTTALYSGFLQELIVRHKLTVRSLPSSSSRITGGGRSGGPTITPVMFTTQVEGLFPQFASFLQEFYSLNLPHSIRGMSIEPLGKGGDSKLSITLKVEVLTMSNIPDRDFVLPMPDSGVLWLETAAAWRGMGHGIALGLSQFSSAGLFGGARLAAQARPARTYSAMQRKNIFAGLAREAASPGILGPAPPDRDILKNVQLTYITANYIAEDAMLWNRMTNEFVKVRAEGGLNTFTIHDANRQVVLKGKVLAIKPRDLVFESEGKVFLLHVGQFMGDALKKELTAQELKHFDVEYTATDRE